MSLPAPLQHVMDNLEGGAPGLRILTRTRERSAPDDWLQMVVLKDDLGRVQVIFRADSLLDIDRLNRTLGRNLRALPLKDMAQLQQKFRFESLPPVPALTGLETVVVEEVRALDTVSFAGGEADKAFTMQGEDYQRLLDKARWVAGCSRCLKDIPVNQDHPEQDLAQIRQAVEKFTSLRIQQRLEDTLELPPLPETARKIIRLRMESHPEVGALADIVEGDPSLAAQVVSWASSSFYASQTPVRSIYDAIMRVLGFDLVMNLSMGLALGRSLSIPRDNPEGFMGYWNQSIWMAQTSALVVAKMPRTQRPAYGLAYLAGLLNNFGYLVLAHVFPPHFTLTCRYAEVNRHVDSRYVEQHLIGVTREQISAQLMDVWNMPKEVVVALRHQKYPVYDCDHCVYAQILYVARSLLSRRGLDLGPPLALSDELLGKLGLNREALEEEMDLLVESSSDVLTMASMLQAG